MTLRRDASAGYLTNWAARLFARAIDRRLREAGFSSGQLPVFFALADGGALSQKALTRIAAIEQPTMAATLTRMERDGLIIRKPDPADGRSLLISLTEKAKREVERVQEAVSEVNAAALAHLDGPEREALLSTLKQVVANLEKMTDGERSVAAEARESAIGSTVEKG